MEMHKNAPCGNDSINPKVVAVAQSRVRLQWLQDKIKTLRICVHCHLHAVYVGFVLDLYYAQRSVNHGVPLYVRSYSRSLGETSCTG